MKILVTLLLSISLNLVAGCRSRQSSNIKEVEKFEHVSERKWKVTCKRGTLEKGEPYAEVGQDVIAKDMEARIQGKPPILCAQKELNGGSKNDAPNGGVIGLALSVDSCQNWTPVSLKDFTITVSPDAFTNESASVQVLKFCNAFAKPFDAFLNENLSLKKYLLGENSLNIAFQIEVTNAPGFFDYGQINVPLNFQASKDSFVAFLKSKGPTMLMTFEGIKMDVSLAEIKASWGEPCYTADYGDTSWSVSQIKASCNKKRLLVGCGNDGNVLRLAAVGSKEAVFKDTVDNSVTTEGQTSWYFNTAKAMGFSPAGSNVLLNNCDTEYSGSEQKLCWHVGNSQMQAGYRCGNWKNNTGEDYKRYIFSAN